jgi:hypothetical protein
MFNQLRSVAQAFQSEDVFFNEVPPRVHSVIIVRKDVYDDAGQDMMYTLVSWQYGLVDDPDAEFVGTEEECEEWVAQNYPYLV